MNNIDLTEAIETPSIFSEIFTRERIAQLIVSLVIIVIAVIAWRIIRHTYRKLVQKKDGGLPADGKAGTVTAVILNIIKGIIILVVVILVLEVNGIRVTSLVAGLGIASAIVGLALQDFLKDVVSGFHLMSDDFFQVGDVVRYGTVEGVVTSFNLRSTKLRSLADNSILAVSNHNITEIVKLSDQLYLDLPLSYEADPAYAKETLSALCREAEKNITGLLESSCLGIAELQDSSVIYKIKVVCPPELKIGIRRQVLELLFAGAREAGLEVPYNQMDVHVK
ncbi:MAG: mechanosensitive ion channel family protein [Eubacterium sp.]|nr:mechanosensitive ion channel family protein [Eubacterium sp.]